MKASSYMSKNSWACVSCFLKDFPKLSYKIKVSRPQSLLLHQMSRNSQAFYFGLLWSPIKHLLQHTSISWWRAIHEFHARTKTASTNYCETTTRKWSVQKKSLHWWVRVAMLFEINGITYNDDPKKWWQSPSGCLSIKRKKEKRSLMGSFIGRFLYHYQSWCIFFQKFGEFIHFLKPYTLHIAKNAK